MRKIIFILSFFIYSNSYAQDPSFSQIDLNMMYMNPAFAGFDNNNRVLILRRSQWSGINEYFNSNIIEFNARRYLSENDLCLPLVQQIVTELKVNAGSNGTTSDLVNRINESAPVILSTNLSRLS